MFSGGASDWDDGGLRQYRISGSRGFGRRSPPEAEGNLGFMEPQTSLYIVI